MLTPAAYRKRAQRAIPLTKCEECGSTERLQRHHYNGLENYLDVKILCQKCHTKADIKLGKWGQGPRKIKICVICHSEFTDYSHSRVSTCGRKYWSELARRNALKRWHGSKAVD